MQSTRVWARVLGVERGVVIERVDAETDTDEIVVRCRLRRGRARRCGECGRRCPGYDQGDGRRRWRALEKTLDVEQGEDGMFRIVRKVARDRVISTVDPDARHGHKSRNRRFEGYKGAPVGRPGLGADR